MDQEQEKKKLFEAVQKATPDGDEIKKILLLEALLIDISERGNNDVQLDAVPERNEIRQEAINKYTTGLLPQTSVSAGSVFKSFYHDLVLRKTEITFRLRHSRVYRRAQDKRWISKLYDSSSPT